MRQTVTKLGFQTAIFSLGGILTSGIGFFLLPLYTRYLTPADYGSLELVNTFYAIANQFIMLGLGTAMYRSFFRAGNVKQKKTIVSTTAFFLVCYTFLLMAPIFVFSEYLFETLFGRGAAPVWVKIVVGTLFVNCLLQLPLRLLRAEEKAIKYVVIDLLIFLITLCLNILFIVKFRLGVLGILESRLIATCAGMLLALPVLLKNLSIRFSVSEIKNQLFFGIPLIFANFAFLIIDLSDRYFLKAMVGLDELGLYSVAYKFGTLVTFFIVTPFSLAWGPFMFSVYKQDNAKEIYASVAKYYIIVVCTVFLAISMFGKDAIIIMVDSKFYSSYRFIPTITAGIAMGSLIHLSGIGFQLRGKTNYLALVNWCVAVASVIIFFLLIKVFGVWGAAIAVAVTKATLVFFQFIISQRLYAIPYNFKQILITILMCLAILLIDYSMSQDLLVLDVLVKFCLLVLFVWSLFLTNILPKNLFLRLKELSRISI